MAKIPLGVVLGRWKVVWSGFSSSVVGYAVLMLAAALVTFVILINKKTASAAEALAFALQANRRAVVVGRPSAGAAHMNSWYVVNDEVFVSVSTGAPTLPGTDRSWEGRGVQPDQTVAEGDEIEYVRRKVGRN